MLPDKMPITLNGKAQLESELKRLMHEERPAVIKAIEEARAQGDISENAEYDAAKERQSLIEGRIADIQSKLASAEVINISQIKSDRVVFGASVNLRDIETEEQSLYQIVGIDEADVKLGKISILSPLARALIGRREGDIVLVKGPKAEKEYEIISFEFK